MQGQVHITLHASRRGLRLVKTTAWTGCRSDIPTDGPAETARDLGTTPISRRVCGAQRGGEDPGRAVDVERISTRFTLLQPLAVPGGSDQARILAEGRVQPHGEGGNGGAVPGQSRRRAHASPGRAAPGRLAGPRFGGRRDAPPSQVHHPRVPHQGSSGARGLADRRRPHPTARRCSEISGVSRRYLLWDFSTRSQSKHPIQEDRDPVWPPGARAGPGFAYSI